MNQKENQMQKEKNVLRKTLIIITLLCSTFNFSQGKIEGEYYSTDETGDYFSNYTFKNGTFYTESRGHLGVVNYGSGHYFIKNDSLILNYHLTELQTNDYHKYKYFENNKDSIKVKITIRDTNNNPLSNIAVINPANKINEVSNKKGVLKFSLKKKKGKLELHVVNNNLGYYISFLTNRSYEIDVFLRQDNYATAFKNQIVRYKILEISRNSITLQKEKHTIMLKIKKDN